MAILKCAALTKKYGRAPALEGLDMAVEPGRIVGLLGPNGSGKTTLIKLANGLLRPSSGQILVDGLEPGVETKKLISYLPERTCVPDWMSGEGHRPQGKAPAPVQGQPGEGAAHHGHGPEGPALSSG